MMERIPVIDISPIALTNLKPAHHQFNIVATDLAQALSTCGFAYLKHHGVEEKTISQCFQQSKNFFALPQNTKNQYSRGIHSIQGYSTKGREILESNIFEEKETLDVQGVAPSCVLPDQELPNLRNALSDLTSQIKDLATRLLKCLALGLQIDPNEFLQQHSGILNCDDDVHNASAIRLLHYPPVNKKFVQQNSEDSKITRCGKHTDYGGLTLLFQDSLGGLEVQTLDGSQWTPMPPLEGTIVVNIGDLLQFWSGGQFRATPHRVIVDQQTFNQSRYSMAIFIHPNHHTAIKPLNSKALCNTKSNTEMLTEHQQDNNTKSAWEHIKQRFSQTYLT